MTAALTREVHAIDRNLALFEVITLQEQVDRSTSPQLVAVTLVGVLGGLALLLAAIGLYGVMSYAVSQSTRELGLRMALGATPSHLLRLVMSRGLALTAAGIVGGHSGGAGVDTAAWVSALQREPTRPAIVWVGIARHHGRVAGSMFLCPPGVQQEQIRCRLYGISHQGRLLWMFHDHSQARLADGARSFMPGWVWL